VGHQLPSLRPRHLDPRVLAVGYWPDVVWPTVI
jgi:hypothetical protein